MENFIFAGLNRTRAFRRAKNNAAAHVSPLCRQSPLRELPCRRNCCNECPLRYSPKKPEGIFETGAASARRWSVMPKTEQSQTTAIQQLLKKKCQ